MSVAEITDKLGLHSLQRRTWVCYPLLLQILLLLRPANTNYAAVHPIDLRHFR